MVDVHIKDSKRVFYKIKSGNIYVSDSYEPDVQASD